MTIEKKLLGTSPSGGATDVADVFSTHLYTGNYNVGSVVNDIDLAGEGGMVWIKARNYADNHVIMDTERGGTKWLKSNGTNAEATASNLITSFNSDGFTRGNNGSISDQNNFVSWTFRKKKKFFDIVTYTGNGAAGREIAHGLGGPVGMMIIKQRNGTTGWATWHKGANSGNAYLELNETDAQNTNGRFFWGNNTSYIAPTSTEFTVATDTVVNDNGQTYVAYLFADNSSEDAEDQMIKCGSFTGDTTINLGWEPQFVLYKRTDSSDHWMILDTMRGWETYRPNHAMKPLRANLPNVEYNTTNYHYATPTGIKFGSLGGSEAYIYMAIRAPMMKEPEAATDVFAMDTRGSSAATADGVVFHSNFPVDLAITKSMSGSSNWEFYNRSRGDQSLSTNSTGQAASQGGHKFDSMHGFDVRTLSANTNEGWMWKRAKGYMDVVNYNGTSAARTQAHSLGVAPEMMWVKCTNSNGTEWGVYHTAIGNTKFMFLHSNQVASTHPLWNDTNPTDSVFSLGSTAETNGNNKTYVAHLFATLAGVSKVGSYTGNGGTQTINCGFSSGARFILIKNTEAAYDWMLWDTVRGIVAGNDPYLMINGNNANQTEYDFVDPHNSGFIVNNFGDVNQSGKLFIFYAIA